MLNGQNNDGSSKAIYADWLSRHKGTDAISGSRTADMKAAVVEAFHIGNRRRSVIDPERVADDYASDLLLPRYLLEPMLKPLSRFNLNVAREISEVFDASLTATILKIAETNHFPIMLVSHSQKGRAWFRKAPSVPEHWFPKDELDHEGYAFAALFGKQDDKGGPRRIGADAWFDRRGADDFDVYEETFRVADDQICTVLLFKDAKMLRE